jgi:hypothetical protein
MQILAVMVRAKADEFTEATIEAAEDAIAPGVKRQLDMPVPVDYCPVFQAVDPLIRSQLR